MKFPNRETVERVRREYPVGTRVELVRMDDVQAPSIGTQGTRSREWMTRQASWSAGTTAATSMWSTALMPAGNCHKIHKFRLKSLCNICSGLTCYYPLLGIIKKYWVKSKC